MTPKGKKSEGRNTSKVEGDHNFVINPYSVGGDFHVHGGRRIFQNKRVRIAASVGGVAVLVAAGIFGWTRYQAASTELPMTVAVETITPTCGTSWVVPRAPSEIDVSGLTNGSTLQHGWRDWAGGADGSAAAA